MGVFFDTSTPENRNLMEEFDKAFGSFREKSSEYLKSLLSKNIQPLAYVPEIKKALELYEQAPLPSVANSSQDDFKKLVSLTLAEALLVEKALCKISEPSPEGNIMLGIFENMMDMSQRTVGQLKFRSISLPMMQKALNSVPPGF